MYPKQASHGRQRSNSNSRTGAREQLAELLVNKFRNRYSISAATERDLDASLQKEISRVVKQEASVTERDLNELDKKISALVTSARGAAQASDKSHQACKDDTRSVKSVAPSVAKSVASSKKQGVFDIDEQIRRQTQGKDFGMTNAEWNETVQNQYKDYVSQERVKQERLAVQREEMKKELEKQIRFKSEREALARQ